MRFGKDVSGLLILALVLCVGCQGLRYRRNQAVAPPPRRLPDTKPAPPLRIETSPNSSLPPAPPSNVDSRPLPERPTSAAADPLADVRRLHRLAAERYASVDGYVARMRRRETVNGTAGPEELIELTFRKQPWSVRLKWLGGKAEGREVVYVQGQHDDKLHTKLARSDPGAFLLKKVALSPDDPRVRNSSRHRITDAGVGVMIEHLGVCLHALEQGDKRLGTLSHVSAQQRPEFAQPLEGIQEVIPPGNEPGLPSGGRRLCLFDPRTQLPALITTHDDRGQEVEYYCYETLQYPVSLSDADFDPNRLWATRR